MRTPRRWWRECERLGLGHGVGECVFCGSSSIDRYARELILAETERALYQGVNALMAAAASMEQGLAMKDLKES